ncbi:TPA: glycosyltransferase [Clostridium perfringens]
MNIMVFIPNLDYGGVSNYSIRSVEMLKEEYENVYLVTFNNSRKFECNELCLIEGEKLINKISNLRKFIKNKKINKVITSIDLAPVITKISCLGIKVDIFSIFHMRPELYKLNSNLILKNKIFDYLLEVSFKISKNIITVSKGLEEEVKEKYSKFNNKILTIYNPIIKELEKKEVNYVDIENKKEINILNVGWIYDLKNQMEILEVIKLFDNDRVKLTIIGGIKDEVYYKKLLKFIEENDIKDVKFIGEVSNVKEYFKKVDLYVLSSKSEALPTVLIEALENNVPIIANDCKYGPREILESGTFGVIYNNGSFDLKEKIEKVINNNRLYNSLIKKSGLKAKEFTYENILEKYICLLES